MPRLDYYAVLEVAPDATEESIKKSYRKLALRYHPDHNRGKQEAEDKIREINAAYEVLNNQDSRKAYDLLRFGGYRQQVDGFDAETESTPDPVTVFQAMVETIRDAARKDIFSALIKDQARIQEELVIIRERVVAKQGYDTFQEKVVVQRAREILQDFVSAEVRGKRQQLLDVAHQMLLSQGLCVDQRENEVKELRRQLEKYYDEGWVEGYKQACQLFYVRR